MSKKLKEIYEKYSHTQLAKKAHKIDPSFEVSEYEQDKKAELIQFIEEEG